jgi:hypothetical protein
MEKGESLDLGEGAMIARSTGETGRYKLSVPGERARRITGAAAAARLVMEAGIEYQDKEGRDGQ